ncbi:MAG: M15 family metallopeptidase [Bacteroidota bacterium]
MNRYFIVSIFIFLLTIGYFLQIWKAEDKSYTLDEVESVCDSSEIPKYSIFDVANNLNSNYDFDKNARRIILLIIDSQGVESLFSVDSSQNSLQIINDSLSSFGSLSAADSITLKALLVPNSKLYERWWSLVQPYREDFLVRRNRLFEYLPAELPNYEFKILSDLRQSENQQKLLKLGMSATPLSLHQFGLATDIAIKRRGKYMKGYTFYHIMGKEAIQQGLTWGGNFVGFMDLGHIQLFVNSAKLLSIIPELRFEFEPYRSYYNERIEKMTLEGKANLVEDSKELIQIMDLLNDEKLCLCESKIETVNIQEIDQNQKLLSIQYQKESDYLVYLNEKSKYIKIYSPFDNSTKMTLGIWK